jgi:sporulation protein YlmC with PRC-barrel domain
MLMGLLTVGLPGSVLAARGQAQGQDTPFGYAKASDLIGKDIENADGDDLGDVEDLLIDRNGQVAFALVERNFFSRSGDAYVPVPWSVLRFDKDGDYVLNINKDRLNQAPSVDDDNWRKLDDAEYALAVYEFYGATPPMDVARGVERNTGMLRVSKSLMGEIVDLGNEFVIIKEQRGREITLRIDEDTKLPRDLAPGDQVTARYDQKRHAEIIKKMQ